MTAARAAWRSYGQPIAALEQHLRDELQPAMWRANAEARRAGFGHRHGAQRRARDANRAVDTAHSEIAAIHAQGAVVKAHLDGLTTRAAELYRLAHPTIAGQALEHHREDLFDRTERLIATIDTCTTWAAGHPTRPSDLVDAVDEFTQTARRASTPGLHPGDIDRSKWAQTIEPTITWLTRHGISLDIQPSINLDHAAPELDLDL